MAYHDLELDRITRRLAGGHKSGCTCQRCRRCARRRAARFEAPLQPARVDTRVGTAPGAISLPEWRGWRAGVSLYDILKLANRVDILLKAVRPQPKTPPRAMLDAAWRAHTGQSTGMPLPFRYYFIRTAMVYRIGRVGQTVEAIDVGMTTSTPVAFRMMAHFMPRNRLSTAVGRVSGRHMGLLVGVRGKIPQNSATGVVSVPRALRGFQVHIGRFSPKLLHRGGTDIRYMHAFEIVLQRRERTRTYNRRSRTFED